MDSAAATARSNELRAKFKRAVMKARGKLDSFKGFSTNEESAIPVTRHRFDTTKEKWTTDEVKVIIEPNALNTALPGAQREIFRMKLLSKWRGADNYVAKRYRKHIGATKEMYFLDCKMQMLAKKMAENYNKLKPPHRIDFVECFVIETSIQGQTHYFCAEKFIDGSYEKHSGNNGFVQEAHHRMTPHAFSHFSYVMSGGKRMIVDIQGVGDLWTDPQIHSVTDEEFGLGNMGLIGMAKFFRTYRYNPLCEWIGLIDFQQSPHDPREKIDWTEYSHDWKIEDLMAKRNPQRASIAKRSGKLGAEVHFQLAKMYEDGSFEERVDLESAFFHTVQAADLGHKDAHVLLYKLYGGIPRDRLVEYSVSEDSYASYSHALDAAKLGDLNCMHIVAQHFDGTLKAEGITVHWGHAIKWYQTLVDDHENLTEEEVVDNEEDFEMHKILAKMAQLYETATGSDVGLKRSAGKAAVLYSEAACAAEQHFKAKLAAKYYEKAAELEEEVDQDESASEAPTPSEPRSPAPGGSTTDLESMGELSLSGTPCDSPVARRPAPLSVPRSGWWEGALIGMIDNFVSYIKHKAQADGAILTEAEEKKRAENFLMAYEESKHEMDEELAPNHEEVKTWMLLCLDHPGKSAERDDLQAKHLDHIRTKPGHVKLGGVVKGPDGVVKGSHYVLRLPEADAKKFLAEDPYTIAGVYATTELMEWEVEWNTLNISKAAEKALMAS